MDLEEKWQKTLAETKILRFFRLGLSTHEATTVHYIFLGSSEINVGDTVVRKGKVVIDRPMILLPKNIPQFSGFELEDELGTDDESLRFFMLLRGVQFPSLKYQNEHGSLDVFEGDIPKATTYFKVELDQAEDLSTGLLVGPAECWQLSVLVYVSLLINRSSQSDIEKLLEEWRRGMKE